MGDAEAAAVAVYRLRSMLKGFGTDRSFWKLKISAGCLKVPVVLFPYVVDMAQYLSCKQRLAIWTRLHDNRILVASCRRAVQEDSRSGHRVRVCLNAAPE